MALFKKVLIANRGEIALRVLRALRALDIASVAIYHEAERGAPFVRVADEAVEISGESPTAAYLDIAQIIAVCRQLNVDAVHPGYGFLSENTGFVRALDAEGIVFIGPSASVIELMGDKIVSRNFVERYGFPVPPSLSVDAERIDKAAVEALREQVAAMGYPVVVKAAAGGGGKGMSIVRVADELEGCLRVAASEAKKYFGDQRIYLERYFSSARHIEVQVLGDADTVIHLGVRECSIQRRFQKVVEEAPSPALSEEKSHQICETAVGIARAANYTNAGTVEFLYTPEGEFFFLEMNTRIQVEHPVTELVYGVDLVVEQIRVAAGQKISLQQSDVVANGHSIECRICAEDPQNDFLPETGRVLYLEAPSGDCVRFDSSLYQNQVIGSAFDPMLAKLVVHAPTREQAISRAISALKSLVVLGVKTNADYLVRLLQHPAFAAGDFDTGFIARYASDLAVAEISQDEIHGVLAAAYLFDRNTQLLFTATPDPYAAIGHWRN